MPKPGITDTVPAMLTPGEHVINREAVDILGAGKIAAANKAGLGIRKMTAAQGYANGGEVGATAASSRNLAAPSDVAMAAFQKSLDTTPSTSTGLVKRNDKDYGGAPVGSIGGQAVDMRTGAPIEKTSTFKGIKPIIPGVTRTGDSFSNIPAMGGVKPAGVNNALKSTFTPTALNFSTPNEQYTPPAGMASALTPSATGLSTPNEEYKPQAVQGFAEGTLNPKGVQLEPIAADTIQATPKAAGGIMKTTGGGSSVGSFTPTTEEIAAQRYASTETKTGISGSLKTLAAKERAIARPPLPEISAEGMKPGYEPRSTLSLAPREAPPAFQMEAIKTPVNEGFDFLGKSERGIKARPSTTFIGPKASPIVEPTLAEQMGGAKQSARIAPEAAKMGGAASYTPPKVDPFTGGAVKPAAWEGVGTKIAGAAKGIVKGGARILGGMPVQVLASDIVNKEALKHDVSSGNVGVGTVIRAIGALASRLPKYAAERASEAITGKKAPAIQEYSLNQPAKEAEISPTAPKEAEAEGKETMAPVEAKPALMPAVEEAIPKTLPAQEQPEVTRTTTAEGKDRMTFPGGYIEQAPGANPLSLSATQGIHNRSTPESLAELARTIARNADPAFQKRLAEQAKIVNDRIAERKAGEGKSAKGAAKEAALARLEDIALNQGPNGSMSPTEFGRVARRQKSAQTLLAGRQSQQQAEEGNVIEREKLAQQQKNLEGTAAATAAEREYTHKMGETEAGRKEKELSLKEQDLEDKPRLHTINGENLYVTDEQAAGLQAQADKEKRIEEFKTKNPAGLFESKEEHTARAEQAVNNPAAVNADQYLQNTLTAYKKATPVEQAALAKAYKARFGQDLPGA